MSSLVVPTGITLQQLAVLVQGQIVNSWLFPTETPGIAGFWGTGPLMFVGDQPSMSPWPERDAGRRLFYGKLAKYGLGESHLTDFYKARGKSGLLRSWKRTGLPADWQTVHRPILEAELRIVQPTTVIAIGALAHELLTNFIPTVRSRLFKMLHFAHGVKPGHLLDYEAALRVACGMQPSSISASKSLLLGQGLSDPFRVRTIYAIGPGSPSRLNPQESALIFTLSSVCPQGHFVTEEVLRNALQQKVYLQTRQDPWHIWPR